MKRVDCVWDRHDGVRETTVMLETVPRDGVSALRDDETMFLQQSHTLGCGVDRDLQLGWDGGIADHTLPGPSVLEPQRVCIDGQLVHMEP